jgi:histidine triad (HIT) family protein
MACIFCDIASGAIPATIVYSSPDVTAFRDINPQAPTHVLIIPNRHIGSLADLGQADKGLLARLVEVANELARREGIAQSGYRVVTNVGPNAGQTVPHLHLHLLGGRPMTWPPG